ncbi:12682_t:CDS:2 [Racocetra persica]|uniref:12682_t:CDS:1 n=1 Tax=Racocetra persica TaxID=160502 RepID=A0ACA9MW50_9GLOM|nr:12682_t:CDS:2 [Racocetra persica]
MNQRFLVQQLRYTCEHEMQKSEPNIKLIAQQERINSCKQEPQIFVIELNKRAIAQQNRREGERAENSKESNIKEKLMNNKLEEKQENVRHNLGCMDAVCVHCRVLYWLDERLVNSLKTNLKFKKCCNHEQVILPLLSHMFTSLGVTIDHAVLDEQESNSENDLAVYHYFNSAMDRRQYNLLTSGKIAIILPGDRSTPKAIRNIRSHLARKIRQTLLNNNGYPFKDQSRAPHLT